jgi:ubiquinone/menaquinone biosynthesis C-methylase UbiE
MAAERTYVPATGHGFFLPLYDPLTKLAGIGKLQGMLIVQAELQPGHAVLDIGCGTGTLAVAIKRAYPGVTVVGMDPDPPALARSVRKARRAGVSVRFDRGFADALDYADGAFDRVFSSMMFHHLGRDERSRVLAEVRRVLKPGGRLEFFDLAGGTHNFFGRMLHGRSVTAAGEDRLIRRMREAGLVDAAHTATQTTVFGPIAFYQAAAPAPSIGASSTAS